jgi:DNA-binding protein H-NS
MMGVKIINKIILIIPIREVEVRVIEEEAELIKIMNKESKEEEAREEAEVEEEANHSKISNSIIKRK